MYLIKRILLNLENKKETGKGSSRSKVIEKYINILIGRCQLTYSLLLQNISYLIII